jgi:hypothetical protein
VHLFPVTFALTGATLNRLLIDSDGREGAGVAENAPPVPSSPSPSHLLTSFGIFPKDVTISSASFGVLPKDTGVVRTSFAFLPKDD